MKMKKFLLVLLAFSLAFSIASCGGAKRCDSCVDDDGDGVCDVCKKAMPEDEIADVPLFEDGEPTFHIVLEQGAAGEVRQAVNNTLKADVKDAYDVSITSFTEGSDNDTPLDVEILVGNVTSRGEKYSFDGHTLGKKGYVIKIVGSKIIINGGSAESLVHAIEEFTEFLVDRDDYYEVTMTKEDVVLEIQDDYKIDSLKVNGTDMKGYTFAVDLTREYYEEAAISLQDTIYDKTGYWFNIVDIENATEKSIVMKHAPGVTGNESFKVYANGTQLVIECAFDNMLEDTAFQFATQHITTARGDVDFKGTVFAQDISVVYYDDFGAKGDGRTDDFLAIYNAHVFANESGQTVKASRKPKGKVYYIYDTRLSEYNDSSVVSIPIKTNTDWQNVKFVIDDLKIPVFTVSQTDPTRNDPNYNEKSHTMHLNMGRKPIFEVLPDDEHKNIVFSDRAVIDKIVADGLNPDTTKIDLKIDGWDGELMLVPYNAQHGVFRRRGAYGSLQSIGAAMHELIVIDKDGNVSPETPIMFEYTNIDYIQVYKLDPSSAITVGNADVETISSRIQNKRFDTVTGKNLFSTAYINRSMTVSRSYTVVENVRHDVTGGYTLKERANGYESCNYTGFFTAVNANHVTFRNCEMHGKQKYDGHSSYDFGANLVNKIVLENCIQPNFWITVDPHEGIMVEHRDYVEGAYTSMSTVQVYNDQGKLVDVGMCWGIGGTNYCKNMEYIGSQLSRFDAHSGLYNGKIINSNINYMALTGYGDMIVEGSTWYQADTSTAMLALRSDYGYQWDGDIVVKDTKAYIFDVTPTTPTLKIVGHGYTNFYYGYPTVFPNITVDNLDVYSTKNQAPVAAGYEIHLFPFKEGAKKMHLLGDSGSKAVFACYDGDKDGYIDEPLFDFNFDGRIDDADKVDFDEDGKIGNTSILYATYKDLDIKEQNKGITHPTCTKNLNTIKPPEYIKIINNDGVDGSGGYVFNIVNSAVDNISDGGWYRDKDAPDTMGGFFGGTTFIYGTGKDDYFVGSDHIGQTKTTTFKFRGYY